MDPAADPEVALRAERAERAEQVRALQAAFAHLVAAVENSNADDEHDPEGATLALERSQLAAQLARGRQAVVAVDAALARLRDGGYGLCERCGGPIAAARLRARPTAATCIDCAAAGPRRR